MTTTGENHDGDQIVNAQLAGMGKSHDDGCDNRRIFVTVGTTSFDELIGVVDDIEFHQRARQLGYRKMTIQLGRGSALPCGLGLEPNQDLSLVQGEQQPRCQKGVQGDKYLDVSVYRFKSTLMDDIKRSELIIGHAGAGTILETLRMNKKLLVVINESLMHNHQWEIANELESRHHLLTATPSTLLHVLHSINKNQLKPWPSSSTLPLYSIIEDLTGVNVSANS